MSSPAIAARPKPERDEKRENILKQAYAAFLSDGYAATSMSSISAKVGGSKATLYNYFSSKEELFAAVIEEKCHDLQAMFVNTQLDTTDFKKLLTQLGEKMLHLILRDDNIATFRLITAESARFPELGRLFYMSGRQRGKQMLGDFFAEAQKAGKLKPGNPRDMAMLFAELCKGELVVLKVWNVNPKPTEKEIKATIATAITVFLAAYGA